MEKDRAIKIVLSHFKHSEQYNQLRPGETDLAVSCFTQGFMAMLNLAQTLKLSQQDFDAVIEALDEHFANLGVDVYTI